ncbi:hypothetical protein H4R35_003685, partial [Dimargaris xerosporica]
YLQYTQLCAAALRNVVKADVAAAFAKRQTTPIKVAKWENGKAVETKTLLENLQN